MHAGDYTVYAELQLGRDEEAAADVDAMGKIQGYSPKAFGAHFGLAAARARYMTERADWGGAAQLAAQQNEFPQVMAITYFARALGAARSGQVDAAKGDLAKVGEMREALKAAKVGYWPSIVDIQYQVANAWILDAEGKTDEARTAMRTAAEAEDKTEKSPVTPGPLAPARELYGQMLLAHGKAKEAADAFAATMAKEPNRFNGYLGAAQAAAKLGDKANAKANYQKLLALTAGAGAGRAEIVAAKAYVADN
jgi:predicted Zn-dependent protease